MMSFGCCPLFAVAVGSVSCFMLCVSVSAFLWFWHRDGLWSLHTGLSLRAPTGLFVFSFRMLVMCFFRSACRLACCVSCFVCWLCFCCGCFVGCVVFLLVFSAGCVLFAGCCLLAVCLLVCWLVLVFGCFAGFSAFRPFLLVVWSSGAGGCENVNSGFSRVFGMVGCCFEKRSYVHGRIHMILGDYGGILAVFL